VISQEHFTSLLVTPTELTATDIAVMEETLALYPYFQIGYSLLAKGHFNITNSDQATDHLTKAAAYALSRNALRKLVNEELMEDIKHHQVNTIHHVGYKPAIIQQDTLPKKPVVTVRLKNNLPKQNTPTKKIQDSDTNGEIPIESNKLQTFRAIYYSEEILSNVLNNNVRLLSGLSEHQEQQWSLIDNFIKTQPRIKRFKPDDPVPMVDGIVERTSPYKTNVITESFAKIQAKAGNLKLAVETYERLILKYPQKRTYFATKIAEIRSKAEQE
jgi:hypothetical protein